MKPPQYTRIKTKYPGVFLRETDKGKIFYIRYRRPGNRNLKEEGSTVNHRTEKRGNQMKLNALLGYIDLILKTYLIATSQIKPMKEAGL